MITVFNEKASQNFQNFPSRGPAKRTRKVIVPPKGYKFLAFDYSQLEARVLAMASKDENWCDSIWNDVDIHRRWAERVIEDCPSVIGVSSLKEATDKQIATYRKLIKNQLVFPWLYGSSMFSVMKSLGVDEHIIRPIYSDFWEEYAGAKIWQEDTVSYFNDNGFAITLTGRKRHRPLAFNKIINAPIQGTASDIVIEAGNRLSRKAYELNKPELQFKLNIHDDLSFYIPEECVEEDILIIAKEMVNPLVWDFINVPLGVEASIGNNWGELEKVMEFTSIDFYEYDKETNRWS